MPRHNSAVLALGILGILGSLPAQALPTAPAQVRESAGAAVVASSSLSELLATARDHLDREDPIAALGGFRRAVEIEPRSFAAKLGLAETFLFLGRPDPAGVAIEAARRIAPRSQVAMAVHIRILIRKGAFDRALRMSKRGLSRFKKPGAKLLAAHASALFRVQRTVDAAEIYQQVIALDPMCAEAHLRLGSGLLPPRRVPYVHAITEGIRAQRNGDLYRARKSFAQALSESPSHPVAHRLLGEVLFAQRFEASMVRTAESFRKLEKALPVPTVDQLPLAKFMPSYARLGEARKRVAARALALFGSRLKILVAMRGRHDLLREDERTTDAAVRADLRGKRTFDGRVWDDVRGIGGLRAATGIEALDEARQFGFDTLAHEVAHQAHLYAFPPLHRAKITAYYKEAKKHGRCLDFYAASNEAEYFGQGVEAFVSLAKRPGCEKTHGHTRFELKRRDPKLYDLIERLVEFDPLRTAVGRATLLPLAVQAALRSGRTEDARTAAEMMAPSERRSELLAQARAASDE